MMRHAVLAGFTAVIVTVGANIATAQQPQQAKSLQFVVASIRPGKPPTDPRQGVSRTDSSGPGGQYRMVNIPLKEWVKMGLSISDYALKAPSWLDTTRFDLTARLPDQMSNNALPEMMKSLLIERFGLKWHEENVTVSGYELVTDKKVLIHPTTPQDRQRHPGGSGSGPTRLSGFNKQMPELAKMLGNVLGKPVVDATHLSGTYDFDLIWHDAARGNGSDDSSLPGSIFSALQEQLGLRLRNAKVPSKVIVVDNINRQPTGN